MTPVQQERQFQLDRINKLLQIPAIYKFVLHKISEKPTIDIEDAVQIALWKYEGVADEEIN